MSKTPNQRLPLKVNNTTLLPEIYQTAPVGKMINATLDLATSKGQLLNFNNTWGLRNANRPEESFFFNESDTVREESQTNLSFVVSDDVGNYIGKSSYLDINNYFKIKNLPLKTPAQLDKEVLNLNLPIDNLMISEYQQYYWLPSDLPIITLTIESPVSILEDIVGKPYATLKDSVTNKNLNLATGMKLILLGAVKEAEYLTTNQDKPTVLYVHGVGTSIQLINTSINDLRIPLSNFTNIPWDNSDVATEYALTGWGGTNENYSWDANTYVSIDPEYIVIDRYDKSGSPWSVINKWYHISLIKIVAEFLEISVTSIAKSSNQAVRPIIQYNSDLTLSNYPKTTIAEIQSLLPGSVNDLEYQNVTTIKDATGYFLKNGDIVIFDQNLSTYTVSGVGTNIKFTPNTLSPINDDGVLFVIENSVLFQKIIFKSKIIHQLTDTVNALINSDLINVGNPTTLTDYFGYNIKNNDLVVFVNTSGIYQAKTYIDRGVAKFKFIPHTSITDHDGFKIKDTSFVWLNNQWSQETVWSFAQNKTSKNQAPKFKFFNVDQKDLATVYDNQTIGGIILDFESGSIRDNVLQRSITISNIDFEVVDNTDPMTISSNQIRYTTDIDLITINNSLVNGPFYYQTTFGLQSFWQNRQGLDYTADLQTITYQQSVETAWTTKINPVASGVNQIHVFSADNDLKFYFKLDNAGYIKFNSINSMDTIARFIPLISGNNFEIHCHDLPYELTFLTNNVVGSSSKAIAIESNYIINNSIKNGVITINLNDTVRINNKNVANPISEDLTKLLFSYNNIYRSAIVRPVYKWRFLFNTYFQDKTYPIFYDYEYSITDTTNFDGSLSYEKTLNSTILFNNIAQTGDQLIIESIQDYPTQSTAPLSLTHNPLNSNLSTINYYGLYQHSTDLYSGGPYIKETIDTSYTDNITNSLIDVKLTNGTITKHNNPIATLSIMSSCFPYDLEDLLIKQGKHYDSFLTRLKAELEKVVNNYGQNNYTSLAMLNIALNQLFLNRNDDNGFWYHSNMIGWNNKSKSKIEITEKIDNTGQINLTGQLAPISFRAGAETLLHITYNNRLLIRNQDYYLESNISDYYTSIKFNDKFKNQSITISSWTSDFKSFIPSSLAKIGLAPLYKPEIWFDNTTTVPVMVYDVIDSGNYASVENKGLDGGDHDYNDADTSSYDSGDLEENHAVYLIRHDGTRYRLINSVDGNDYPINPVDQLLYEYELAVWSSISHDIEHNDFSEYVQDRPGGFRQNAIKWQSARDIVNTDIITWQTENNIFITDNNSYDINDPFTYRYSISGSNDNEPECQGSWRAIYKFYYDTDRPHTHPWEMLGYSIKPTWWDTHYSWVDPDKRKDLEKNLRLGNRSRPPTIRPNPYFARINNISDPEEFPVDKNGNLIAPASLSWLSNSITYNNNPWEPGDFSPYDQVFLNTQRGLASEIKLTYLLSPSRYVTNNWLPGNIIRKGIFKLTRTNNIWVTPNIDHTYHRQVVDGVTTYTSGIESLLSEFCQLNNIDFYTNVVQLLNNTDIKKEFLLQGFTNKNNVRIQSTSINSQKTILFIPEENYQVRTVKHYPHLEIYYSAMRILWDGNNYIVYGFTSENPYFSYYLPKSLSPTRAITIGSVVLKEKTTYDKTKTYQLNYGTVFVDRQQLFDFIIGYGLYLMDQGFQFNQPEAGQIKDWRLSAEQFIYWSNDLMISGNYIDLNPAADAIILNSTGNGQLESLIGTNLNPGLCVDRFGKALFSKDLLVQRDNITTIKTKDLDRAIYGIKLVYSIYESVIHLDSNSIFNDIYFLPDQSTTKRSFKIGGRKIYQWDGTYFAYGYMFDNFNLIPNYDSYAEVGNQLLTIENSIEDSTIIDAGRAEFGLNRDIALRKLFLTDDVETQFKNSIAFNKGTINTFTSLEPLTHKNDNTKTIAHEEYMVRIGELGNVNNIEYYEFELFLNDINSKDYQILKFNDNVNSIVNSDITYIPPTDRSRWVYTPYNKPLKFTPAENINQLKTSGPIMPGDTDYSVTTLGDIPYLYNEFSPLFNINAYDNNKVYKSNDQFRINGQLYSVIAHPTTNSSIATAANAGNRTLSINHVVAPGYLVVSSAVPAGTSVVSFDSSSKQITLTNSTTMPVNVKDTISFINPAKITTIEEPYLPNIFVQNYNKPNPNLTNQPDSIFTPGTWQVIQTIDRTLGIEETCVGPNNSSLARITIMSDHLLAVGDLVLIVNANTKISSVNGIWPVMQLEPNNAKQFYINTKITDTIRSGKIFTFKPVRFKNKKELEAATAPNNPHGYAWHPKFLPHTNALGTTHIIPPPTTSGYPSQTPIAIIDQTTTTTNPSINSSYTFDSGDYSVWTITGEGTSNLIKQESASIDTSDIEHLIIYDHTKNETLVKLELFDPKRLIIPQVLLNEIDIINRVDPARYNRTNDTYKSIYTSMGWYKELIGVRWWDTSTLQFADYDSGSDLNKYNNWAKLINNNTPDVYEWTASPVPPNQWNTLVAKNGMAYNQKATGSAYVNNYNGIDNYYWVEEQNYNSGNVYTTYYFWVKNKQTIPVESKTARVYAVGTLANILLNPSAAGIAWWAPISTDAIIVKGIKLNLNNNSTVAQIKKKFKGNNKSQQWLFISDNDEVKPIPEFLHIRLRDSLSGVSVYQQKYVYVKFNSFDNKKYAKGTIVLYNNEYYRANTNISNGPFNSNQWTKITNFYVVDNATLVIYNYKNVPDSANLHPFNWLGNDIRPYPQSWFAKLYDARRVFFEQINLKLKNIDLVKGVNGWNNRLTSNQQFAELSIDTGENSGLWYYADYQSDDFDINKAINVIILTLKEIFTTPANVGDYIKVLNDDSENYAIYKKLNNNGYSVVYRQNGTIQFSDQLIHYTTPVVNNNSNNNITSWDGDLWDQNSWDYGLTTSLSFNNLNDKILMAKISTIVDALRYDIFVLNYAVNYNKIMCIMLRYVLSEQLNVNWVQKSSTIEPVNLINQSLSRIAELERDDIDVLTGFYNSVKAYRDKIRDSNVIKSNLEVTQVEMIESHDINIQMEYKRINDGTYILPSYTGTEFVRLGWDSDIFLPSAGNSYYQDTSYDATKTYTTVTRIEDIFSCDLNDHDYVRYENRFYFIVFEKITNGFKIIYRSEYNQYPNMQDTTWDGIDWDIADVSWDDSELGDVIIDPDHDDLGWDYTTNNSSWDPSQEENDVDIQYIYDGSGTPNIILAGSNKSKWYTPVRTTPNLASDLNDKAGEELIKIHIPDGLTMDVTNEFTNGNNVTVRIHQYNNMVNMFIADSTLASLSTPVTITDTQILLNNTNKLREASLDNIQYVWINNEQIGYSIKTNNGITGLIRGAHGTAISSHDITDKVYVENALTELIPLTPLQSLGLTAPFFNEWKHKNWDSEMWDSDQSFDEVWDSYYIETLENTNSVYASTIKNYVSS
jgi:hypothetical protein